MPQIAQGDESIDVEDLPQEVIDALPEDIREEILTGVRDQIPENVVESLTPAIADQIPEGLIGAAAADPALTSAVVVIALLSVAGAIIGAIKGFIKVALFLGLIAAAAWFFIFRS